MYFRPHAFIFFEQVIELHLCHPPALNPLIRLGLRTHLSRSRARRKHERRVVMGSIDGMPIHKDRWHKILIRLGITSLPPFRTYEFHFKPYFFPYLAECCLIHILTRIDMPARRTPVVVFLMQTKKDRVPENHERVDTKIEIVIVMRHR